MRTVRSVWLGAFLLLVALGMRGAAAPPPAATPPVTAPPCEVPQTPRNVDPAATPRPCTVTSSLVSVSGSQDEVKLYARPGECAERLVRCGQHYHAPVENVQGCPGETVLIPPKGKTPGVGQWIEVHTVYAPAVKAPGTCDPESLNCCVGHPVVVLGFSAKVTAGNQNGPILTPTTGEQVEFLGSNTGPDATPTACKPIAAYWNFRLTHPRCVPPGIPQAQLERNFPGGFQGARELQAGVRISKGMVLVK